MDTGDMILKEEIPIGEDETTGEVWEKLSKIGAKLLVSTLKRIEEGTAPREKQGKDYTMAPMLEKSMAKIDWENKSGQELKNLVRGLNPIMGAYTYLRGKKIKFWKVDTITKEEFLLIYDEFRDYDYKFSDIAPGTVLYVTEKHGLYVKTKDGVLSILQIQGENSKKMSIQDFLFVNKIEATEMFE